MASDATLSLAAIVGLDGTEAAPLLLNKVLVHGATAGRIIEVEAYLSDDPASHSFRGATDRNRAMFGPPGRLYVYLIYGMYHCANVVTGADGDGQAVLIRAIEPVAGRDEMRRRRGRTPLADGPGKLCQALAIDRGHDGIDLLAGGELRLADDGIAPPSHPIIGPRIGISTATDRLWRWRCPPTNSNNSAL